MSRDAPPRSETARQALRDALKDGPFTAHELSARAGIAERDIVGHLEHLEKTAKAHGERLEVEPARCDACGFTFKKRDRLSRPGRCPVCRGSHLVPPRFTLFVKPQT
jgi:predicted Zn-ribbon and HTH transcriptional regulator